TTKILRVVNSSLFGLSREVSDLNQALALLGTKPLKMLVLGFSLPKNLFNALESTVLSKYWLHTLTKAVVARELALRLWHASGEEAFIAGLLQEIGQLVLIQDLGEPYVRFANRVYESGGNLLSMELETLGFDHAVLSARLLDHWGLPPAIVHAVGISHDADQILALPLREQSLPQILHLADLIARMLAGEGNHLLPELVEAGRRYRRLMIEDLPVLLTDLDVKVQQLADALQLQIAASTDYRLLLIEAHAQLSQVAEEAVRELHEVRDVWQETVDLSHAISDFAQTSPGHPDSPAEPGALRPTKPYRGAKSDTVPIITASRHAVAATSVVAWCDPGLEGRVAMAIASNRQLRRPVSLALVEVDGYDQWIMALGRNATESLMRHLQQRLQAIVDNAGRLTHLGDGQFTLLLEDYDRSQSVETTRQLQTAIRDWAQQYAEEWGQVLSISVGIASVLAPAKNYPSRELIAAAQRCLQGAQLSGGDTLKSIEFV
ncbi:MAG TPA: HDOD domain-containing protein, partial [Pirellulaceae bacterium]|nr:HDOD domain-containing protein [Pirellulaceae bacterium]